MKRYLQTKHPGGSSPDDGLNDTKDRMVGWTAIAIAVQWSVESKAIGYFEGR